MSIGKVGAVVLDCPDPVALARFYAELVGGDVELGEDDGDTWVDLKGSDGAALAFQAAPGFVAPGWPSAEKSQQFHLDVTVEDLDAAEAKVLALGATVLDAEDRKRSFRVYADPAGHPFCLCAC
ncbi:VOC family protein [Streptomyces peucetius]|uniref:VOC family protein n=1 Tax=Streptomyces peucetius TaxID=1950 RepID=A0ABY6I6L4_STRPE|nr:VOC family protein [Streptomyces peucetius]UYQ62481.1 VOC family protein [Streptomyces peucetius]